MGHSAGGHLALLYAYSTADNYTNPNVNPIKLVISEAGPSYFTENILENLQPLQQNEILAMVGGNNTVDLYNASPLTYVTSSVPNTILAYGYGVTCPNGESGDGFLPFSQAEAIFNALGASRCSLFELTGIRHENFGDDGDNDYEDTVFPGSTDEMVHEYYYGKSENGQIVVPGLQQLINSHLFGNN